MWGGPTPHNLVILCLCYANQTSSEVPISSSNRDTARLGRGDRILLPSVIPAQVQGRHNTTRSTLSIGYPLHIQRHPTRHRIMPGIPPFLAVASVDRTQQGIWGWPVQSPRHPQVLILSQKPRRKQKKRAITLCITFQQCSHKLAFHRIHYQILDCQNNKGQTGIGRERLENRKDLVLTNCLLHDSKHALVLMFLIPAMLSSENEMQITIEGPTELQPCSPQSTTTV